MEKRNIRSRSYEYVATNDVDLTKFLSSFQWFVRSLSLSIYLSPLLTRVTHGWMETYRMHVYVSDRRIVVTGADREGGALYTRGMKHTPVPPSRLSSFVTEARLRWRADSMDGSAHRPEANAHLRTLERPDDERSFHLTEQTRDKRPIERS